jgi:hypothetical protein
MDDPNTVTITTKEQSMFVFKLLVVSAVVRRTWTALLTEMRRKGWIWRRQPEIFEFVGFCLLPIGGMHISGRAFRFLALSDQRPREKPGHRVEIPLTPWWPGITD